MPWERCHWEAFTARRVKKTKTAATSTLEFGTSLYRSTPQGAADVRTFSVCLAIDLLALQGPQHSNTALLRNGCACVPSAALRFMLITYGPLQPISLITELLITYSVERDNLSRKPLDPDPTSGRILFAEVKLLKPKTDHLYPPHEFAVLAGVTVRALHHYDRLGLLKPVSRTQAGYRLYSEHDLARLEQIVLLKFLGFSLKQIGELLTLTRTCWTRFDANDLPSAQSGLSSIGRSRQSAKRNRLLPAVPGLIGKSLSRSSRRLK